MMRTILRGTALAAFLFTATAATAQQPAPAFKTYRAKEVLGMKIALNGVANPVGVIDDLVFDSGGNMEYLIVNNDGKLFTVPFDAATFDPAKRMAELPLTQEQYKVIPTYTTTTYPNFYTPEYRTSIYKHYNLTPRELRILRRR